MPPVKPRLRLERRRCEKRQQVPKSPRRNKLFGQFCLDFLLALANVYRQSRLAIVAYPEFGQRLWFHDGAFNSINFIFWDRVDHIYILVEMIRIVRL